MNNAFRSVVLIYILCTFMNILLYLRSKDSYVITKLYVPSEKELRRSEKGTYTDMKIENAELSKTKVRKDSNSKKRKSEMNSNMMDQISELLSDKETKQVYDRNRSSTSRLHQRKATDRHTETHPNVNANGRPDTLLQARRETKYIMPKEVQLQEQIIHSEKHNRLSKTQSNGQTRHTKTFKGNKEKQLSGHAEIKSETLAKLRAKGNKEKQLSGHAEIKSETLAKLHAKEHTEKEYVGTQSKWDTGLQSNNHIERSAERQTYHQRNTVKGDGDRKHRKAKETETNAKFLEDWNVVYDEEELYIELQRIHEALYKPNHENECIKRNPGCIIVGVAKCGTRELSDFASMHPNIVVKSNPYKIQSYWFENERRRSLLKQKMPCTYSDQVGMIKADNYFTDAKKPRQINRLDPDIKLVVLVREPVERIQSQLSYRTVKHHVTNSSAQIKAERRYLTYKGELRHKGALALSSYDDALERYLKFFKREQILIIESNEFTSDPIDVLVKLERFLGIQHVFTDKHLVYNPVKKFYCLRRFHSLSNEMVCYGGDRGRHKKSDMDEKSFKKLKDYFKPHNENFFKMLGKRFKW